MYSASGLAGVYRAKKNGNGLLVAPMDADILGNSFETDRANLFSGYPSPVGTYPTGASPYDVMDMAGNVFEWTTSSANGTYLVRGGSWTKYSFRGRVTDRGTWLEPSFANYDVGFAASGKIVL